MCRRKLSVEPNTEMSAVQPARSSRCGQSVGTLTRLPSADAPMLATSCRTAGSLTVSEPVTVSAEDSSTASRSSWVIAPGQPVTSA